MKNSFNPGFEFGTARPGDEEAIRRHFALAFAFDRARSDEYLANAGLETMRTVRDAAGTIRACAALPFASHCFGGEQIPAANIALVAIAPEARGTGLARPFVNALCEDARKNGALMVTLFASARPVYRVSGFELAGSEIVYEAETATLPSRTPVEFFPIEPDDERIRRAYARKTQFEAGMLARADIHWRELFHKPAGALSVYGAGNDGVLDAYVIIDASDPNMLEVRDWHAASGDLAAAVLCFLGRFRSVYPKVKWHGGPDDELVAAMPDKGWRLAHQEEWLARILDPAAALERRGYISQDASFNLSITDPEGDIHLALTLSGGSMQVSVGMSDNLPTITVERPFFSSLFTGFSPASRLMRRGRLAGPTETVQTCDLVFAGPKPWVAEHF